MAFESLSQSVEFEEPDYLGEDLNYIISYGIWNAGLGRLTYDKDSISGMYHIKAIGRTIGLANVLYKILDIYDSYIDPETGLPVKAIRNAREGSYSEYNEVTFDHFSRPDSVIAISQKSGIHVLPKGILDILSGFYYLRKNYISKEMKEGEMFLVKTYFTDELWDFRIRYMGRETIKTKLGKIDCLMFNPVTEVGRAFKTEDDMTIWISDDKNLIPVKVRVDLRIGSFKVNLVDYSGLNHEFSSLHRKK